MPISSINFYVNTMTNILFALVDKYVALPDENEMPSLSESFATMSNIHGTILALDGTHIPIRKPTSASSRYHNRKRYCSLNYLVACDSNCVIRYIFGGGFGSSHDAFIFNSATIKQWILNLPSQYHVFADAAYPLIDNLVKPVCSPNTQQEKNMNYLISKQRII